MQDLTRAFPVQDLTRAFLTRAFPIVQLSRVIGSAATTSRIKRD